MQNGGLVRDVAVGVGGVALKADAFARLNDNVLLISRDFDCTGEKSDKLGGTPQMRLRLPMAAGSQLHIVDGELPVFIVRKKAVRRYIENYQKPDFYRWAVIEKSRGKNIGQIAFCRVYSDCRTAEIEYCIGQSFWGNGYAGEALNGLIDFTFSNTDFQKLEAYHRNENVKSGRVLEKSLMHITDTVERFIREGLSPYGEVCYCIDRSTYELNNHKSK